MNRRLLPCALAMLLAAAPRPAAGGASGTLDRLVADLDAKLGSALDGRDAGQLDFGLAMRGLGATPPRLVQVVAELLLPRLRARGLRSVARVPEGMEAGPRRAWAAGRGMELLLELDVMMGGGYLHLVGGLRSCERNLWRDTLHPRPGLLNHLHASARVDAEVRAYLGVLAADRLRLSLAEHKQSGSAALALGAGDLDGDGRVELVALLPREVRVLRYLGRRKGFKLLARAPLQGDPASRRPRRAMGALVVTDLDGDRKAEVLVRSSEMARGAELRLVDRALSRQREFDGYPLAATSGDALLCPAAPGKDLLAGGGAGRLDSQQVRTPVPGLPAEFYTYREASVPRKDGSPVGYSAVVDSAGRLVLSRVDKGAHARLTTLRRVGAAFHLADLTDDGTLEVIVSGAGSPEQEDRLMIHRLEGPKLSGAVWSSAGLRGVVTALAHGALDGDGKLDLVAAVSGRRGGARLVVLQ